MRSLIGHFTVDAANQTKDFEPVSEAGRWCNAHSANRARIPPAERLISVLLRHGKMRAL
jgi:hypothetical protein